MFNYLVQTTIWVTCLSYLQSYLYWISFQSTVQNDLFKIGCPKKRRSKLVVQNRPCKVRRSKLASIHPASGLAYLPIIIGTRQKKKTFTTLQRFWEEWFEGQMSRIIVSRWSQFLTIIRIRKKNSKNVIGFLLSKLSFEDHHGLASENSGEPPRHSGRVSPICLTS